MILQDIKETKRYGHTDGRSFGRSFGRSDNVKTVYPPTNKVCGGYKKTTTTDYIRKLYTHRHKCRGYNFSLGVKYMSFHFPDRTLITYSRVRSAHLSPGLPTGLTRVNPGWVLSLILEKVGNTG